jgi:hypothetical protein
MPEEHSAFPVPENIDPIAIIQGRPPIDQDERSRQAQRAADAD